VAYEGGTHIVGQGPVVDDDAITGFYTSYSYSQEMADLYRQLLDGWRAGGGTLFMVFVDTAVPSKWGSWGALRHLDDANPRWDVLVAANAVPPDWEERAPSTFDQGVQHFGTPGSDTLDGTPEEDDLLGFGGDDRLVGHGGSDRLHGGAGRDRAVLPGAAQDWTQDKVDDAVLLRRGREEVRLTAVEEVEFEGTEDVLTIDPEP
jgi:Ca2+-binding RTX toxin-like protein